MSSKKLLEAQDSLDQCFGTDYSKNHPEVVVQYLLAQSIQDIDETLATSAIQFLNLADKFSSLVATFDTSNIFKNLFSK
jgi:hypothetical protein